jgi:GH15 family glucan-1,4-alpha-glucosidase
VRNAKIVLANIILISVLRAGVPLDGTWLFNIGDDTSWSQIDYNDSAWYSIKVPGSWENQGFANYDGIAWYRKYFEVDTALIGQDSLFLHLGIVHDANQVFINNLPVGQNGSAENHITGDTAKFQYYILPANYLTRKNLIAIRVFNQSGSGGIIQGPTKIASTPPQLSKLTEHSQPHQSYPILTFSNGIAVATYDVKKCEFGNLRPHLYSQYDEKTKTPILATSARTILFKERCEIPITELATYAAGYIDGTGIIYHQQKSKELKLIQYAFAPFSLDKPMWVFYAILEGDSLGSYALNFEINDKNQNLYVNKWSFQEQDRKWLFVVCYYDNNPNAKPFNINRKYKNDHPGFTALTEEIKWWKNWHAITIMPPNINRIETAVYLQSLVTLKMAQCREKFPARGQIISAFLPPSLAIASVTNMSFAIDALLLSGHTEEALSALQFLMNGRCGQYKHYKFGDSSIGIGQNYAISVNYYYGNGSEASRVGDYGPDLYLGGFGTVLWNLKQYVEITDDIKFLEYYWPRISTEIADVLLGLIDNTGLLRADNGLFNPGVAKHYAYTTAAAYRGLVDAAWLARMADDEQRASSYEEAAITLHHQFELNLYNEDQNALKGYMEGTSPGIPIDAASAFALLWIFTPQDYICKGTLSVFDKQLFVNNGYRRFPAVKNKPRNEWVPGDMLLSIINQRATDFKKTESLKRWITEQAYQNYGLIPEYLHFQSADYIEPVPLVGLGAGLYVYSFWGE